MHQIKSPIFTPILITFHVPATLVPIKLSYQMTISWCILTMFKDA